MIVFFDIDGTLVSDDEKHTVPHDAMNAIKKARQNGHLMYINTGRTMNNVDMYIREIGFDGYVCGCGTYVESGGNVLYYRTMPKEKCYEMAQLMKECDMAPVYERCDTFFYDKSLRPIGGLDELIKILTKEGKDFSRDVTDPDFGFDKLVAWYDEKSDMERFRKGIASDYDFIDRGHGFCELQAKGLSKGTGATWVTVSDDAALENALVFAPTVSGDFVVILTAKDGAGREAELKFTVKVAEFVTTRLWDGGIENALRHYNLI